MKIGNEKNWVMLKLFFDKCFWEIETMIRNAVIGSAHNNYVTEVAYVNNLEQIMLIVFYNSARFCIPCYQSFRGNNTA